MNRLLSLLSIVFTLLLCFVSAHAEVIITDKESNSPLPKASIFDKNGVFIGITDNDGKISGEISSGSFPLNIRYVGYVPVNIASPDAGIVKMQESTYSLPELTVDDVSRNLLYIRAYERNYQSGVDPNDTLLYYTERIVDFVLPLTKKAGHKGWKKGRILGERTYTHVKQKRNDKSRDTLKYQENRYNQTYDYALDDKFEIPHSILNGDSVKVLIQGKYYPKDEWTKMGDKYVLIRDNLSDKKNHVYSPMALKVLGATVDITRNESVYNFLPDSGGKIKPDIITEVAYFNDITLRGKLWKWASEQKEPIPLQSYGELYVIDRAYLTADEVKELKKNPPEIEITFEAPEGIPDPPAHIVQLKEDVKSQHPEAH